MTIYTSIILFNNDDIDKHKVVSISPNIGQTIISVHFYNASGGIVPYEEGINQYGKIPTYFVLPGAIRAEVVHDFYTNSVNRSVEIYIPPTDVWFEPEHLYLDFKKASEFDDGIYYWLRQNIKGTPEESTMIGSWGNFNYTTHTSSNPEILELYDNFGYIELLKPGTTEMTWTFWRPFAPSITRNVKITVVGAIKMKSTPFPLNFRKMKLIE